MDKKNTEHAAKYLVKYLKECGSEDEADISENRRDIYKPFYRTASLFWAPTLPYLDEVLNGTTPTLDEAKEIMRLAHPFYANALDQFEDEFNHHWEFQRQAWE